MHDKTLYWGQNDELYEDEEKFPQIYNDFEDWTAQNKLKFFTSNHKEKLTLELDQKKSRIFREFYICRLQRRNKYVFWEKDKLQSLSLEEY